MSVTIKVVNANSVQKLFEESPTIARRAMRLAINTVTSRDALKMSQQAIEAELNFPKGYLKPRLAVTQTATESRLEAVISGRDRATSLARFQNIRSAKEGRGKKLRVEVKRGHAVTLDRAFLVNLNNGNLGLAIRSKNKPRNAYKPVLLAKNLWLLYAPSVDQAFGTVVDPMLGDIGKRVDEEFNRQFVRLMNDGD